MNLRKSASTSSQRLTTVPKGAEVTVLDISGDYLHITYKTYTGYIVSDYASVPAQYAPGKALSTDSEAQQHYAYLQSGSTGKNVSLLQEALKELDFYSGTADGSYGASTVAAVKAFQKKNGIRQDGVASPEVQKLIFEGKPLNAKGKKVSVSILPNFPVEEFSAGDKGWQVTDLQNALKSLGFYTAEPTGVYDTATQNAVKKFQSAHHLTVDGIAGKKTLQLLNLLAATASPASTVTPAPEAAATPLTSQNVVVMRNGTKGLEVTRLQNRLMELGYYTCVADGVYNSDEIAAVKEFQRKNGLTVDGVAGLVTQQARGVGIAHAHCGRHRLSYPADPENRQQRRTGFRFADKIKGTGLLYRRGGRPVRQRHCRGREEVPEKQRPDRRRRGGQSDPDEALRQRHGGFRRHPHPDAHAFRHSRRFHAGGQH